MTIWTLLDVPYIDPSLGKQVTKPAARCPSFLRNSGTSRLRKRVRRKGDTHCRPPLEFSAVSQGVQFAKVVEGSLKPRRSLRNGLFLRRNAGP